MKSYITISLGLVIAAIGYYFYTKEKEYLITEVYFVEGKPYSLFTDKKISGVILKQSDNRVHYKKYKNSIIKLEKIVTDKLEKIPEKFTVFNKYDSSTINEYAVGKIFKQYFIKGENKSLTVIKEMKDNAVWTEDIIQETPKEYIGKYTYGHEVEIFTDEKTGVDYWIYGNIDTLNTHMSKLVTKNNLPYVEVKVKIQGIEKGKAENELATENDKQMEVKEYSIVKE
ncbi:MAG: hypothetical protein ACRC6K_01615 [Fusobacteriaceae bacterium]